MSEARNGRFEIDIDEIERQLRRSIEQPAEPKSDPLAELARIVGQDDPFQRILAASQQGRAAPSPQPANVNVQPAYVEPHFEPRAETPAPEDRREAADDRAADQGRYDAPPAFAYDPVADAYGSPGAALAPDDFQPLRRRPSRGKLVAVAAALAVTVSAVAIGMTYRKSGGFLASGAPPVIVADKSPLKVAPENPGGVEVPNQERQIYARAQQDGQSRVVDGREQPIDVRAATPAAPPPAQAERNPAVAEALGEPRRVRTVAVNPDGTSYGPAAGATTTPLASANRNVIPNAGSLPPPVPVQTVAVPTRTAALAPTPAAPVAPVAEAAPPSTHQAVLGVLPPARPRFDDRGAADTDTPTRTASLPQADTRPGAKPKPGAAPDAAAATAEKPAAGPRTFAVQIAVRPSDDEARTAWDQAQEKFGSTLENRPARLTNAQVNGKTVHRVRLGPMTKAEADTLCGRLKSKGGNCFVATN